jgi:hypothetical protein
MGCGYKMSAGTGDVPASVSRPLGNPNPHRFEVHQCEQHGVFYLSVVFYPDCQNFEGLKVLVTRDDPRKLDVLDPHFSRGGTVVARFEPTTEALVLARKFMGMLT